MKKKKKALTKDFFPDGENFLTGVRLPGVRLEHSVPLPQHIERIVGAGGCRMIIYSLVVRAL